MANSFKAGMFGIDTKKIADGALLGAGLLIGAILVSGSIKTVNKFTGGVIPEDFTSFSSSAYYGTGNSLTPDGSGNYWL